LAKKYEVPRSCFNCAEYSYIDGVFWHCAKNGIRFTIDLFGAFPQSAWPCWAYSHESQTS